ncbi:hypothetical protein ACTHP5_21365, partial [Bacillus subtilis]|uniref:hypothetical protein n=1 Tax=Bacillus subtilis TaxID=1423 RepID=UPI003F7BBEFB
ARLRAYSCVVTCLLEHGEMPQRVAGLYRLTTASRPVGEPMKGKGVHFLIFLRSYLRGKRAIPVPNLAVNNEGRTFA